MNCGKSSNWVHWLYAVLTSTFTMIRFSTLVVTAVPFSSEGHLRARPTPHWSSYAPHAYGARDADAQHRDRSWTPQARSAIVTPASASMGAPSAPRTSAERRAAGRARRRPP